jgi:hypothetical protein
MVPSSLSPLAAVFIALSIGFAIADDVPKLDIGPLCRAEAKAAAGFSQNCVADQNKAREELVRTWDQYPAASRATCLDVVNSVPGLQSYIELLTCLQIKKDVGTLPKK